MQIKCPYCDRLVQIPDEYRDETITCPHCRRPIIAHPDDPPASPPPPPPPERVPHPGHGGGAFGLGLILSGLAVVVAIATDGTDTDSRAPAVLFLSAFIFFAASEISRLLGDVVYELRRLNAHHKSPR